MATEVPSVVVKTCAQCSGRLERSQSFMNQVLPLNQVEHDKGRRRRRSSPDPLARLRLSLPGLDAETPNTIVKLDDSRQNVITEEKTMLG